MDTAVNALEQGDDDDDDDEENNKDVSAVTQYQDTAEDPPEQTEPSAAPDSTSEQAQADDESTKIIEGAAPASEETADHQQQSADRAATTLQAQMRGYAARSKVAGMKEEVKGATKAARMAAEEEKRRGAEAQPLEVVGVESEAVDEVVATVETDNSDDATTHMFSFQASNCVPPVPTERFSRCVVVSVLLHHAPS